MRAVLWTTVGLLATLVAGGCEGRMPAEAAGRSLVRPALGLALDVPQGWTFRDLSGDVVLEIYPAPAAAPTIRREITRYDSMSLLAPVEGGSGAEVQRPTGQAELPPVVVRQFRRQT